MKFMMRKQAAALLTATAVFAGTGATLGTSTASAAPVFRFDGFPISGPGGKNFQITVFNNSSRAGSASWVADPVANSAGDTLAAYDGLPDGYAIEAHLSTGRVASTRGHNSPYFIEKSGNLPEGNSYTMWVCVVKDDYRYCSGSYGVRA